MPTRPTTGVLDLAWTSVHGRVTYRRHRYRWPYVVHRLFRPSAADPSQAVVMVQGAGAGLQPGDELRARLEATDGVRVDVRGQGATYVSGAPGGSAAHESFLVRAAAASSVIVDLGPRILTPHAWLTQDCDIVVEHGGAVALVESFVLHPDALHTPDIRFLSCTQVRVADAAAPLAIERQSFDDIALLPVGFRAFASVVVAAPGHMSCPSCLARLTVAGDSTGAYAAASELPAGAGLTLRLAATDGLALRRALAALHATIVDVVHHASSAPVSEITALPDVAR
ncbi:urease accessory protein UreD [Raineyella sp. LH-20]|uniref:urease accessory protein UreD n=1 Tax=Raineyella sp. LH-20 TaxID=3081204 RepID=UPI0029558C7F|nr:urease accessory protein UreD [Raineyella sp. LH-20]WOP20202.1 urease accessory protein UreD [Raineyella sp. LH-20]